METELRNSGLSVVGDVPWGTHFCYFYETKQDLLETLIPYFKAGLETNEFCLWIVSNSELITAKEAMGALERGIPDLGRHLAAGSVQIASHDEWFLEDGSFNRHTVADRFKEALDEAIASGHAGMRVNGSPAWLQARDGKVLREFEKELDQLFRNERIIASCTYPLGAVGGDDLFDTARTHQFAIARRRGEWEILETPELRQAKAEIRRLNEELERLVGERTNELRESEERFREMAEHIDEVFWLATADLSHTLFISRAYETVWGRSRESLYREPRSFFDAIHPEDLSRVVAIIERDRSKGFEAEYRVVRPDGSLRWIRDRGFPIKDASGRFYRVAGIAEDVTERKRAEALLNVREQEFRAIVENSPDQIIRYDREFRRTYVNPAVAKAYGLTAEALLGKPIGSVIRDAWVDVKEDELNQVREGIAGVFDTGKPYEYELTWPMPTGPKHFIVRLFPEFDLHGSVISVLGTSRDITERKQAEEKLKQSESRLAKAQRVAHVGYCERNVETGEITWSDETYRIFGLQPHEPIGSIEALIHPQDRSLQIEETARALRGEDYDMEYRVVRPNGEVRLVHSQGEAIRDESGRTRRSFGTVQDVTELKRTEEKLKTTSEQLRALSSRVQSAREEEGIRIARQIHDELGTALTSLRWDLEGIDKKMSESGARSQFPALRKRIAAMVGVTDTTINVVRRIASELRPSILDDLGLVAAIKWQARQFQDRTGIVVHCDSGQDEVGLSQEESTAVFRIFQEALTNILRHAQASRVDVAMVEEAGEFVLTIGDNGRGIREDEKSGRLSIGLLGMRERAHLIGAEIDVTGVEGEGTLVTVRLPLVRSGK